jgi:diguanylate cyclase (GGDEF)-like protein
MGSSMILPPMTASDPAVGVPAPMVDWALPLTVTTLSILIALCAWTMVADDLGDPARDFRRLWHLSWQSARLPLEALIVSTAVMLAVWWGWLAERFGYPATITPDQLVTVAACLSCVSTFALVMLMFLRTGRRLLAVTAAGLAAWAVAGVVGVVHNVGADEPPWTVAVLLGALPLISTTLAAYPVRGSDRSPQGLDRAERRETLASTCSTVAATSVVVLALPLDETAGSEQMSVMLVVLLILLFTLREAVNAYFRLVLNRRLHDQAVHDQLTGLPNRRGLARALATAHHDVPWVVLLIDLDGFTRVNDELGYQAGDALLAGVGEKLVAVCPPPRVVARLVGDEFAVLSPGDLESGRRLAIAARGAVREAVDEHAASLPVAASIGVGRLAPPQPLDGSRQPPPENRTGHGASFHSFAAVAEATAALRAAKAAGNDRIEVYAGRTERARRRRLAIERRLHAALADDSVEMHLQPIVRLERAVAGAMPSQVAGFEALARWTDDELGVVSPGEFVSVAEQTGLIVPLGERLLRRAVRESAEHGLFDRGLRLSINVSPLQLRSPHFARTLMRDIHAASADPRLITLELTEVVLIDEDDAGLPALSELAGEGLRFAIDDFGTGHAALAYLRRLPLDVLKIDRSLTVGAVNDQRSRAVVASMIHLAQRLDLSVVMEGVEDEQIASVCRRLGAEHGQGWLYGAATSWARASTVDRLIELAAVEAALATDGARAALSVDPQPRSGLAIPGAVRSGGER